MTAKEPKLRPLTSKERKLVKGIAEGKPRYKAAMEAYDTTTPINAGNIANEVLSKPTVQQALEKALANHNLTVDRIIKPVSDALDANKETMISPGVIVATGPDHQIRLNAARIGAIFMGINKNPEPKGGNTFVFNDNRQASSRYVDAD